MSHVSKNAEVAGGLGKPIVTELRARAANAHGWT
ncbi:hypothetical protein ABH999_000692 [Bradyrhizobium yuanmingense]